MVDDAEKFQRELRTLDVPAGEVRHPVVYGRLGRSRSLAVHEYEYARACSDRPVKVALPGPYLLTRTMWLDCLTEPPYETRDELARDVVRVLREEAHFLLASGAALVQFDEPVLTEVVHGNHGDGRTFMCGALSERLEPGPELDFAVSLLNEVVRGPTSRAAGSARVQGELDARRVGGAVGRIWAARGRAETSGSGHALPGACDSARG